MIATLSPTLVPLRAPFGKALRLPRKLAKLAFSIPQELVYRTELTRYANQLPVLSSSDRAIVTALQQEGVFITSLEDLGLPSSEVLLRTARSLIPKLSPVPDLRSGFDTHAKQSDILACPELFQWGLNEGLLDIVENYLGLPAVFNDIHLRRDFANGVKAGSRLWHVDSYDHRILRVFVYLNDVDKEGGPFQYISKQSTQLLVPILEQFGTISEAVVDRLICPTRFKDCTGSAGTVVFAATSSVIHRGKLPTAADRFMIVFNYNSKRLKHIEEGKPKAAREGLVRIAEKLPQRQRNCLLWQ